VTPSFSPLHPLFAARTEGLDLRAALDTMGIREIEEAMDRYAVLVFRDQQLSEDDQLAFTARFGPMDSGRHLAVRQHRRVRSEFADVSNLDEAGNVADRNHRRILSNMATRLWHTDSSYKRPAAKFSLLYCSAIPDWGGETEFADIRAAFDALPERLRAEAEGREAEHYVHHSRATLGFAPTEEEIAGAAENGEPLACDRQMQDRLLGADRAVAFADRGFVEIGLDAKPHPAAMTAALVGFQHGSPLRSGGRLPRDAAAA